MFSEALRILSHPYVVYPVLALVGFAIYRKLAFLVGDRLAQRTGTLIVYIGDIAKMQPSVASVLHLIPRVCRHPTLWRILGWKAGGEVALMRIITSGPQRLQNLGIIRYPLKLRPVWNEHEIKTGTVEARKLHPILKRKECKDHYTAHISGRIPRADTVIVVTTDDGGTGAAHTAADISALIGSAIRARTLILVTVETVPADSKRRLNIEFINEHFLTSSYRTAELNILIQQKKGEIEFMNDNVPFFIAALASGESEGEDLDNISRRLSPEFVCVIDLGNIPAEPVGFADRVAQAFEGIMEKMPDALLERVYFRTTDLHFDGKKLGIVMLEPEDVKMLDDVVKAVEGLTKSRVVGKKAVEWERNAVRIFILVSLDRRELGCTEIGLKLSPDEIRPKPEAPKELKVTIEAPIASQSPGSTPKESSMGVSAPSIKNSLAIK